MYSWGKSASKVIHFINMFEICRNYFDPNAISYSMWQSKKFLGSLSFDKSSKFSLRLNFYFLNFQYGSFADFEWPFGQGLALFLESKRIYVGNMRRRCKYSSLEQRRYELITCFHEFCNYEYTIFFTKFYFFSTRYNFLIEIKQWNKNANVTVSVNKKNTLCSPFVKFFS